MKSGDIENGRDANVSRRDFIGKVGASAAGLFLVPFVKPSGVLAYDHVLTSFLATVAVAKTTDTPSDSYVYDDPGGGVRQKVQYLFGLLNQNGELSSLFAGGKKVVVKINLTGGSGSAGNPALQGVPIQEAMWTHPAVVRAVVQSIIDAGVNAADITIAESLGSGDSFTNAPFQGYVDIQTELGCGLVDLSKGTFVDVSTGAGYSNYASLTLNKVLVDADVYVSLPKLKHHAEAGFTGSIKNQVGSVPQALYETAAIHYRRQALHSPTNGSSAVFLPGSICDLAAARPVHFAVVDGIRNATGGEGVWNPSFAPSRSHVLLAGLDPVATDSVGATLMGLDCQASKFPLPARSSYGDTECDNHLDLLNTKGVGTNQLSQIQIVGDASVVSVRPDAGVGQPAEFRLCANFPNPFNPSTMIVFYLPHKAFMTLAVHDITGRAIETLIEGDVPAGEHRLQWSAEGLATGVYLCRMTTMHSSSTIKLLYQK